MLSSGRDTLLRLSGSFGLLGSATAGLWGMLLGIGFRWENVHWLLVVALAVEYGMLVLACIAGFSAIWGISATPPFRLEDSIGPALILAQRIIKRLAHTTVVFSLSAGALYLVATQSSEENAAVLKTIFRYVIAFAGANAILLAIVSIWCPPWDE